MCFLSVFYSKSANDLNKFLTTQQKIPHCLAKNLPTGMSMVLGKWIITPIQVGW